MVAALEELGDEVSRDDVEGHEVDLGFVEAADLDECLIHLKDLSNLKSVRLDGPSVTDAALIHIKGLRRLEILQLR